jgi:hypothetical protein
LGELGIDLMKLDYVDRQLVVVRPDDVVLSARREARQPPRSADQGSANDTEAERAVLALAVPIAEAISMAARWWQRRTERRTVSVLPITRSEARRLQFSVGHPRDDVVYVGNPAAPSVYVPLAEFHRQTFAHKFSEALTLVSALGARTMTVAALQGWSREFATGLNLTVPLRLSSGEGQTEVRSKSSRGFLYTAELKGSGDPRLPKDLRWYLHEPEWQSFARQRIEHDLREFTLKVRYDEDFAITADVASKISKVGLTSGGAFHRHQSTVWSIAATFPPNQSRAVRAIKHPFG